MAEFYDTHAHLDFPDFASDLPDVLSRAKAAGISKIICIGTDLESSRRAITLSEQHTELYAVVGWHPSHVMEAPADIRGPLKEMTRHAKVVALGETGLDYHRLPSKVAAKKAAAPDAPPGEKPVFPESFAGQDAEYKSRQAELFRQHLEVASETGLNCVIHQRESLEVTLTQLEPYSKKVRGVFHCFAENPATMQRILAMNSLVSFTGILSFKSGQNIRDTLAATPIDRFMLETDCPFLAPTPYRGKRCEPAYVKEISELAAELKKCSGEELSEVTCTTAKSFFRNIA